MNKNKDLAENTDKAITEEKEYILGWDEEVRKIVNMAYEQWVLLTGKKRDEFEKGGKVK